MTRNLILSFIIGCLTLGASANDVEGQRRCHRVDAPMMQFDTLIPGNSAVSKARTKQAKPSRATADNLNVTGDFDFTYYWMSSSGQLEDTWEYSIVEIVEGEEPDQYLVKGMLADTFKEDVGSGGVKDIVADYDPATNTLTIEGEQPLFTLDMGGTTYDIRLYGVGRDTNGWRIGAEGSMKFLRTDKGWELVEGSDLEGFFVGARNPISGGYMGYGCVMFPDFYEFNGVMLYAVTVDVDPTVEPTPWMCDIFTRVLDNGKIVISNFVDQGYYKELTLNYDLEAGYAWCYNHSMGWLTDSEGDKVDYFICDSHTDDANYGLPWMDGQDYLFTAAIVTDKSGNCCLVPSMWGLYLYQQPMACYTYTNVMLFMPLPDQSGVESVKIDDTEAPVYYDLYGRRVENPRSGQLVISRGRKVIIK